MHRQECTHKIVFHREHITTIDLINTETRYGDGRRRSIFV